MTVEMWIRGHRSSLALAWLLAISGSVGVGVLAGIIAETAINAVIHFVLVGPR